MKYFLLSLVVSFSISLMGQEDVKKPDYKITNFIKCDGVRGEKWYLSRLRTKEGKRIYFNRQGSGSRPNPQPDDNIIDIYSIYDSRDDNAKKIDVLYLDMYHSTYIEILCPENYRIVTQFSDQYEYVDGVIHKFGAKEPFTGTITEKYESGAVFAEYKVNKGYINRPVQVLFENGKIRAVEHYKYNRLNGVKKWYSPEGKVRFAYSYKHNIFHGKCMEYSEDGTLLFEGYFDNGKKHGEFKEYFENGKLKKHYFYEKGKIKGDTKEWNQNGELISNDKKEKNDE